MDVCGSLVLSNPVTYYIYFSSVTSSCFSKVLLELLIDHIYTTCTLWKMLTSNKLAVLLWTEFNPVVDMCSYIYLYDLNDFHTLNDQEMLHG